MTQPPTPTEGGDGPQHAKPESAPVPTAGDSAGPAHAAGDPVAGGADPVDDSSPSTDPNLHRSGFPPPGAPAAYPPPGASYPPPGAVAPGGYPPPGGAYPPPGAVPPGGFPTPGYGGTGPQPMPPGGFPPPGAGYPPPPPGFAPPGPGFAPPPPGSPGQFTGPQPMPPGMPGGPAFGGTGPLPAPAGGYPPPPGGYPPGYGTPATPPPGFGAAPSAGFDVGAAFTWAWNKFSKNIGPLVLAILGYAVPMVVLFAVVWMVVMSAAVTSSSGQLGDGDYSGEIALGTGGVVVLILAYLATLAVALLIAIPWVTGLLDIADGRPVTIGSFFKPRNFGNAALTSLLVAGITMVGSLACILPGLIAGLMLQFALAFAIDRGLSPVDAVKASFATCRANLGSVLLLWLVTMVIGFIGEFACVIGLFVAIPLIGLIQIYAYRRFTGGYVDPLPA